MLASFSPRTPSGWFGAVLSLVLTTTHSRLESSVAVLAISDGVAVHSTLGRRYESMDFDRTTIRNQCLPDVADAAWLCLRSLDSRGQFYIETLHRYRSEWVRPTILANEPHGYKNDDWCWHPTRINKNNSNNSSTVVVDSGDTPAHESSSVAAREPPVLRKIRRTSPKSHQQESVVLPIARRIDLFLEEIRNHHVIPLPKSIAELVETTPAIDLTGRWKPSSAVDLDSYEAVLEALEVSYWKRRLLSSWSVVSRQELVVEQTHAALRWIESHPFGVWNATVVATPTNTAPLRYQRVEGPGGEALLVGAYWQQRGTVHTTVSRRYDDDNSNSGWMHFHRYLDNNNNEPSSRRILVVETTHHSMAVPPETELQKWTRFASRNHAKSVTTTTMIWKWEQVLDA